MYASALMRRFHHALLAHGVACANDCMRSDVARVSWHGRDNCPFAVTEEAWDGAPLSTGSSRLRRRVGLNIRTRLLGRRLSSQGPSMKPC